MAGLRHVQERPRLRLLVVAFTALVLFAYPFEFVLPGLLENRLGREAADLGLLMGFSAIAGLAVSVSLAGFVGGRRAWPLMIALGGTLALGLLVVAAAPSFGIALAGMLLVGTGQAGFRLFNTALLMLEAAPPYYGRVYAITILGFGIENIAAAPVGILADAIGERSMLGILGGGTLACTLLTAMAYAALQRRGRRAPLPALEVADGSLGDEADGGRPLARGTFQRLQEWPHGVQERRRVLAVHVVPTVRDRHQAPPGEARRRSAAQRPAPGRSTARPVPRGSGRRRSGPRPARAGRWPARRGRRRPDHGGSDPTC